MLILRMFSLIRVIVYLFLYSVVVGVLILRLYRAKVYRFLDFSNIIGSDKRCLFYIYLDFVSLAGIPPFMGGVPKIFSIFTLWAQFPQAVVLLIVCSIVRFFYYLRVIISTSVMVGINDLSAGEITIRSVEESLFRVSYKIKVNLAKYTFYVITLTRLVVFVIFGFLC